MLMGVRSFAYMSVPMLMGLVSIRSPQAPDTIREPECNEQPGSQVAANGLHALQARNGNAQGDTDQPQHDGTQHVADAAQDRHQRRLGQRPSPGLRHNDKRQIVVRAEKRVQQPD